MLTVVLLLAAIAGYSLTLLLVRYAPTLGLVQVPNFRSSHVRPTPSGGGVAIAAASIASALACAMIEGSAGTALLWILLAALMAGLGLADDRFELRAVYRFPVQIVLVGGAIWLSQPLPDVALLLDFSLDGWALALVLVLAGVWWINLFNFMDGIDGLAGSQALLILASALGIWLVADPVAWAQFEWQLAALSLAATSGFLLINWPPARIFMGDAGSNYLAIVVMAILLALVQSGVLGYAGIVTLVAVFLSDATVTLLRRTARGERPWMAHRRHAYQQLSRRFGHKAITVAYGLLTVLLALPMAILTIFVPNLDWMVATVTILPLIILAIACGAGAHAETAHNK